MAWVVDSCILIDIAIADPTFAKPSATLLNSLRNDGLVICPISVIEIAPLFDGSMTAIGDLATGVGADMETEWTSSDTEAASKAWARYFTMKRLGQVPKRPLADILIGAFALRTGGLLTRNPKHFTPIFPSLPIVTP